MLVAELMTRGPHEIAPLVRRLLPLGNFALEEIAAHFPEPLWARSLAPDSRLPRPDEISATAVALVTFDDEAIPYLARLMRHASATVRYYALLVSGSYSNAMLVESLAQSALDPDRQCRGVALHLLYEYRRETAYQHALGGLRDRVCDSTESPSVRRRAISALTQLRDGDSVALFVDRLTDPDRGIATASRVGLRVLTAHDFGFFREPWLRWLSERGHQRRTQWLIEGLKDGRTNIRVLASRELWTLTHFLEPLSEVDGRDAFVTARQQYGRWCKDNEGP